MLDTAICKELVKGAKRKTNGPWKDICEGIDNKTCRKAIVFLGETGESGLADVKEQLGTDYPTFIKQYESEYRRVESEIAEKKTVEKESIAPTDWEAFDELRELIQKKPSVKTLEEYMELYEKLSPREKKELVQSISDEERETLLKLGKEKQKRETAVGKARKDLAKKIPRTEIETLKHPIDPTEDPWDIDIAVFVPIGVSITIGRITPITDAIEIFAIYFEGRALPELVTIVSYIFIREYEGKVGKLDSYYGGMASKLLALQGYSILRPAAIEAARRLDVIMGVTGKAEEIRAEIEEAIVE